MIIRNLIWLLAIPLARAQGLDTLIEEALRRNPEILAAQKKYEAARQRPSQAGSLPDPMLSLGYTSNGGPWPVAGIGTAATSNVGVMFAQEVPFPGKRKLRTEISSKEADAEFEQYRAVRLSVISRLKQAWHELHHAAVGIEFVGRYQQILTSMLRVSESRYSVGRAPQQDVFKAQTQYAILETQLVRFQQQRAAKEIEINALLNRRGADPVDIPAEMALGEMPATLEELLARGRASAPVLSRDRKLIERGTLATNLARKDYFPDYVVSGGYFNQGSMPPMWQFRVDFKLPATFGRKQSAGVTEQSFMAAEARRTYEATQTDLEARIREQYVMADSARKLASLYEKSVIPGARLGMESAMTAYETGTLDFMPLFSNFMTVVEYELMYHEEVMNFHVALARLEEMAGVEVAQ
jgi:outer membrane protein, heavy metal efflux system